MSWEPIAAGDDLRDRTTFHAQIRGRELVAWRADDDTVNLWENRCLHRGVRLSRGINDGAELVCQYHGWRYSNRTAGCTYIPAHPADAPARTICNRVYPVAERYGLVWTGEGDDGPPIVPGLEETVPLVLRAIPVNAPPETVRRALRDHRFMPAELLLNSAGADDDWRSFRADLDETEVSVIDDETAVVLRARNGDHECGLALWVQPVDAHRSVIRGVLDHTPDPAQRLTVLRHHNDRLSRLRDRIEAEAAEAPMPDPIEVEIEPVAVELAGLPPAGGGRNAPRRVQVARKWQTAEDVVGLALAPLDGGLPTFQPGAHIDVHLANGLIRQYSLTNGPGELDQYRIGVKREPASRGGSAALHDDVREGDVLAISEPRNNFTLRRDSERTVLLAGGIGITPLLAMAQALHHDRLSFELHLFARGPEFLPFADVRAALAGATTESFGLSPEETTAAIRSVLGPHTHSAQVYICGPAPMIAATVDIAGDLGWPEQAVHYEHFSNPTEIDEAGTFEIVLARAGVTLPVGSGQSMLEVLRANGVDLPSSCEQGACGTCIVGVLEGTPLHQDVYLKPSEHEAGDRVATCVSRAASDRLVLDL